MQEFLFIIFLLLVVSNNGIKSIVRSETRGLLLLFFNSLLLLVFFYVGTSFFRQFVIKEILSFNELDLATTGSSCITVIDYQKSKCKPCIKIAPDFLKLSEKYSSKVISASQLLRCLCFELRDFFNCRCNFIKLMRIVLLKL